MTERDDQSIDHELSGVAMAAAYEHEQTVSAAEAEAALGAVRSRIAAGDLGGAPPSIPLRSGSSPRSAWVRFAAVAAAVAMVSLGLVAVAGGRGANNTATPTDVPDTPLPSTAPASTEVADVGASTASTVTTSASTTTSTMPASTTTVTSTSTVQPQVIAVDALDPPRLVEPIPYFEVALEAGEDPDDFEFAVGPDNIIINRVGTQTITIVGPSSGGIDERTLVLDEGLSSIVSGPGTMLYGLGDLVFGDESDEVPTGRRFVAIPFTGEREGEVVASTELAPGAYLEIPDYFFGHGPDGIVSRGLDGATILQYVDDDGQPQDLSESGDNGTPFPVFEVGADPSGGVRIDDAVISLLGSDTSWQLEITRDPAWAGFPFVGANVVAPGLDRAIYAERIGADTRPDLDFGPNATPVVALLNYDGSGEWVRLPEDWEVVASDVWGTLLARVTADSIELASLDDLVPSPGPTERPAVEPPPVNPGVATTTIVDATTTTSVVINPDSGMVQPTAIARSCDSDNRCTQLATSESGRIVSFDQSVGVLRVYDDSGTDLQSEVTIADSLADFPTALLHVGPDDVAYFSTSTQDTPDGSSELIAIPLIGANAGSVVMRWTGVDGTGDSRLIARKSGLTVVPCCGGDGVRPSADATIYRWVDRNGATTESTKPSFDLTLGDNGNSLTRIDTGIDGNPVFTSFTLPTALQFPRDFPTVVATDDGGALAAEFVQTQGGGFVAIVDFGTDWPVNGVDNGDVYYRTEASGTSLVLETGGTVLFGSGDGFVRRELSEVASRSWPAEHEVLDDGTTIVANGFNDFIDETTPVWASDPVLFGYQFVQSIGPNEEVQVTFEDGASPVILVETTGLLDDSVAATQHRIVTERGDDGVFRFVSGTYGFRCVEGRGHQDFSLEPCI